MASNMIAKWYQSASRPWPKAVPKMCAMPTASEGAPPVRANNEVSPTSFARFAICSTVTGKPQPEMVATATSGVAPAMPAPTLIAKNTPGSSSDAAITAMMATRDSIAMLP